MQNTISKKYISDYITKELGCELKHDLVSLTKAVRLTSNKFKFNKKDLFHYIIERRGGIPMTLSYGFDTPYGREIRDNFNYFYNITFYKNN